MAALKKEWTRLQLKRVYQVISVNVKIENNQLKTDQNQTNNTVLNMMESQENHLPNLIEEQDNLPTIIKEQRQWSHSKSLHSPVKKVNSGDDNINNAQNNFQDIKKKKKKKP